LDEIIDPSGGTSLFGGLRSSAFGLFYRSDV
jgi:hypothetical protein